MISFVLATALSIVPLTLPGGAPISIDYLAYDAAHHRVWVPAGNTGNIDVIDTRTGVVTPIVGQATAPSPYAGRPHHGPSSASVGDGVVWVGNRADRRVCAFDAMTLERGACAQLESMPDGILYVHARHELWITTPHDQSLTVVDTHALAGPFVRIAMPGEPEGYATDESGGRFFTNLEDKDGTLVLDMKTRKIVATYKPGCGEEGPRGVAFDAGKQLLVVACTDGVTTLDLAHDGKVVGRAKLGSGIDNLDLKDDVVYAASGETGTLTLLKIGAGGTLRSYASKATAPGARTVIADDEGTAYVADGRSGRILRVKGRR